MIAIRSAVCSSKLLSLTKGITAAEFGKTMMPDSRADSCRQYSHCRDYVSAVEQPALNLDDRSCCSNGSPLPTQLCHAAAAAAVLSRPVGRWEQIGFGCWRFVLIANWPFAGLHRADQQHCWRRLAVRGRDPDLYRNGKASRLPHRARHTARWCFLRIAALDFNCAGCFRSFGVQLRSAYFADVLNRIPPVE